LKPIELRAEGLEFSYNHRPVLQGVDLDVKPGEMVGLLGPNGAGKSTIIKLLSRVILPKSGRVWVDGSELDALKPGEIARRIAVVPQVFDLPAGFTAFDIVMMGRTPHLGLLQTEGARDEDAVRAAMQATGTWELANRLANQLSGGERQRVVIARALAQEPAVLLLDESTAHLDIARQLEIMGLVQRLKRERSLAVLGVFHDLNLAVQYCDRIVLLREGAVVANGVPASVITPDTLRQAYGVDMCVFQHPVTHLPVALI
jgi:iron complex transport system ATP-binding protein